MRRSYSFSFHVQRMIGWYWSHVWISHPMPLGGYTRLQSLITSHFSHSVIYCFLCYPLEGCLIKHLPYVLSPLGLCDVTLGAGDLVLCI